MLVDLYTKDGQKSSQVELDDNVFYIEVPNENAMQKDVVTYLAHNRQGTHKTKGKAEVSGGGKKPWRQKGRGTARSGSNRSPLWAGGGTIHGPQPHKYNLKLPKKVKALARKSALVSRWNEENLMIIEDFTFEEIKTKQVVEILKALNIENESVLMLLPATDYKLFRSARNVPNLSVFTADSISTYDILNHKKIVVFKSAIDVLGKLLVH